MSFDVQMIREHKRDYPEILKAVTPEFLERAGVTVQRDAKRLCPYITGNLMGSINRQNFGTYEEVGTNVEYAEFVEYGVRGRAGKPYLRPAIDQNRKKLTQLLGEMIIAKMVRG